MGKVKYMKKIIKLVLVLIWMAFIFMMSTNIGSNENTIGLFEKILYMFPLKIDDNLFQLLHFIFRKGAHIFEYFILGILLISLLKEYRLKRNKIILITIEIAFIFACFDEVHQCFVLSRSGNVFDIGYDFVGAFFSSFLYYILYKKKSSF